MTGIHMRKIGKEQKGAATVEATIVLPLVMLAILSVLSLIRVAAIYQQVQHCLNQVAQDLSQYSYLYAISGLKEKHDDLLKDINEAKGELIEQQGIISTFYQSIADIAADVTNTEQMDRDSIDSLYTALSGLNSVNSSFEEVAGLAETILTDPMGELKLVCATLSEEFISGTKTILFGEISKIMLGRKLSGDLNIPAQQLEERLRISGGIQKLDFSCSTFLDDNETIDLIVEYNVKPMPDFIFLPEIRLRNRACVLAWTLGVDREAAQASTAGSSESIWNIDQNKNARSQHLKRGNIIDRQFAAELQKMLGEHAEVTPYHFKTIDLIDYAHGNKDGLLITIFSLNPFLPTYSKESAVTGVIKKNLYKLSEFRKYQCNNFIIDMSLLDGNYKRVLYIVIPENSELPEAYLNAFEESKKIAKGLNIELKQVQKYGEYDYEKSVEIEK